MHNIHTFIQIIKKTGAKEAWNFLLIFMNKFEYSFVWL